MLFQLVETFGLKPKYVAATKGGEFHSPCPHCGGDDRFSINPEWRTTQTIGTYSCRQCLIHGNTITFAMQFLGYTYADALKEFAIDNYQPNNHYVTPDPQPIEMKYPTEQWIQAADDLVARCHTVLLDKEEWLEYLNKRGISLEMVKQFKLGYCTSTLYLDRDTFGLPYETNDRGYEKKIWIPEGLIIPYRVDGQVRRIKIRQTHPTEGKGRYIGVTGGQNGMSVYEPSGYCKRLIAVESELDALALVNLSQDKLIVVATGSNIRNPDTYTHEVASRCNLIVIAHDNDAAGKKMYYKWRQFFDMCIKYPTPIGKDVGEAIEQGCDMNEWLEKILK